MTPAQFKAGRHALGLSQHAMARNGIANADATLLHGSFKTITGARRWAKKRLAA